jgi:ribosomal protein L33
MECEVDRNNTARLECKRYTLEDYQKEQQHFTVKINCRACSAHKYIK